jgi:hypothetical protein
MSFSSSKFIWFKLVSKRCAVRFKTGSSHCESCHPFPGNPHSHITVSNNMLGHFAVFRLDPGSSSPVFWVAHLSFYKPRPPGQLSFSRLCPHHGQLSMCPPHIAIASAILSSSCCQLMGPPVFLLSLAHPTEAFISTWARPCSGCMRTLGVQKPQKRRNTRLSQE